ncbi:hypothetical protein ACFL6C_09050 [Myxococcota bacterium]
MQEGEDPVRSTARSVARHGQWSEPPARSSGFAVDALDVLAGLQLDDNPILHEEVEL